MLLGEIISSVRLNVAKELVMEISLIRPRHIYYTFIRKRATVIENRLRDDKRISRTNEQVITCAKLIKSSPVECNCLNLVGCKIYRTECKLPKTLSNTTNYEIKNVTSLDGNLIFIETTWESFNTIKYKKYTADMPHFMVYNDYIYVINNYIDEEPIEYINFSGVFDDPIKVLECNSCNTIDANPDITLPKCDSIYDFEFPLSGKLLDTAVQLTLQELIANYKELTDAYQRTTDINSEER